MQVVHASVNGFEQHIGQPVYGDLVIRIKFECLFKFIAILCQNAYPPMWHCTVRLLDHPLSQTGKQQLLPQWVWYQMVHLGISSVDEQDLIREAIAFVT